MTNLSECVRYSQSEIEQITKALERYAFEVQERETIAGQTITYWIEDFEKLQIDCDEVIRMIEETAKKDKYGKTKFADFLNEDSTYIDHYLVNQLAYKRFLQALKNMNMTYEDYENKCLEITRQRQELADKKLLELPKEKRLLQIQNYKEKK